MRCQAQAKNGPKEKRNFGELPGRTRQRVYSLPGKGAHSAAISKAVLRAEMPLISAFTQPTSSQNAERGQCCKVKAETDKPRLRRSLSIERLCASLEREG